MNQTSPNLMKWELAPTVNHATGDITVTTSMPDLRGQMAVVSHELMRTRDAAFREALIALGWTPPNEKGSDLGSSI